MEHVQDNQLLTNSDFEHLMEDLNSTSFSSFNVDQNFIGQGNGSLPPLQVNHNPPLPSVQYFNGQDNGTLPPLQGNVDPSVQKVLKIEQVPEGMQAPPLVPLPSTSPTGKIPCRDHYPGPLNFEILLDSINTHRKSYVYSEKLNKVFIDMFKSLLVQFRISSYDQACGLSVRALPVYTMEDHVSDPVDRCALHVLNDDMCYKAHTKEPPYCNCSQFQWARHVLRSTHPQAQYQYDTESSRHSVVVPLDQPQAGTDTSTAEFQFACKTSCSRGMNRRPIEVIFTLETDQGHVIGRFVLPVKICSCPRRDMEKEEGDIENKGAPASRKRRASSTLEKQDAPTKIKMEKNSPQNVSTQPSPNGGAEKQNQTSNDAERGVGGNVTEAEMIATLTRIIASQDAMRRGQTEIMASLAHLIDMQAGIARDMAEQVEKTNRIECKLDALFKLFVQDAYQ